MIYRLHYTQFLNEFIEFAPDAFSDIHMACIASEFQKISKEPVEVYTTYEAGGQVFPDFYYYNSVPLFSEPVFKMMKKAEVDNLFEKEVTVIDEIQEKSQKYILGLPPRIRMLDSKGKVNESRIGNYKIFKTADFSDNNIYITESLRQVFLKNKPLGMEMFEADDLYT